MIIAGEWCKDSDEWTFCACVRVSSRASAVIALWQWTAAAAVWRTGEGERESEFRLGPRSRGGKRPESLATATTKAYGIASPWDEQLDVHSAGGGKKLKGKPLGEAI